MQALDTKTALRTATGLFQQQILSLLLTTLLTLPCAIPYILHLIALRLYILIALAEWDSYPLHSVRSCQFLGREAGWLKGKQPVTPMIAAAIPTTQAFPSHFLSTICFSQSYETWGGRWRWKHQGRVGVNP